ncbi:MAG: HAD family hydrolase [Ruminococcus sp.]|uniref:HAD family hydrolase n=1 Tax=Ruminococcus sp. TaxID=41978 RepID=UPI0025DB56F4|nr:HAD family hydrolase [Ruminococcus sp.]MBO4867290.1 HAD family hydrolase [Ruminococcus sp.]
MKVSFDLDDTLFVSEKNFKVEPALRFPLNHIYKERLRAGTIELMKYIRSAGIELWIYTTSFRSERYIRGLFRSYGVQLDEVVNGQRHAEEVQKGHSEGMPSKYPSKYRIDLHIDDDISVAQNGRTYGFKVFTVGAQDDDWANKIIAEIEKIRTRKNAEKR